MKANSHGPTKERCSSRQAQRLTAHWRRSSEWIWVWQQRKRSTPRFSTAADQEGEGSWAAMPRCSAFFAPATGSDTQRSTSFTTVVISELCGGHRDGRRTPRRGQNQRTRTAARDVVSDLRDTRVSGEGQWARLDLELVVTRIVRPRRSARRPSVASRSLTSHRMAQGSETAKKQLTTRCKSTFVLRRNRPFISSSKDRGAKAQRRKEDGANKIPRS